MSNTEITAKHTYGTWRAQPGWKPLDVAKADRCDLFERPLEILLGLVPQGIELNTDRKALPVEEASRVGTHRTGRQCERGAGGEGAREPGSAIE